MPRIQNPELLRAVFVETAKLILAGKAPTRLLFPHESTLWRAVDWIRVRLRTDGSVPRWETNSNLVAWDGDLDNHRFSGISMFADVPAAAALYCSMQSTALSAEVQHYARSSSVRRVAATGFPNMHIALNRKWILKIRSNRQMLALDLSSHTPAGKAFIQELEQTQGVRLARQLTRTAARSLEQQVFDGEDASAARGIGLATSHAGLDAVVAPTARSIEGPSGLPGDNLIIFGKQALKIPFLWIDEVWAVPLSGPVERYNLT